SAPVPRPKASFPAERALTWYVGIGIVAFVAVVLGPSLVGHNSLLGIDKLTTSYPWLAHGSHATGHQLCSGDTIDSQIPATSYVRNQLFHGHLPNWQGLTSGGAPLVSQPNLGLWNPISLPYWLLPLWL